VASEGEHTMKTPRRDLPLWILILNSVSLGAYLEEGNVFWIVVSCLLIAFWCWRHWQVLHPKVDARD
jgi:hypothetical protein